MGFIEALLGIFVAVAAAFFAGQRRGKLRTEQRAQEENQKRADEIRDRIERGLDERVRSLDDAGYRD